MAENVLRTVNSTSVRLVLYVRDTLDEHVCIRKHGLSSNLQIHVAMYYESCSCGLSNKKELF